MKYRCNCCHIWKGARLIWWAPDELYCESCITLKIQEALDAMCDAGYALHTDKGYELTDKGRIWSPSSVRDGAESTTMQDTNASESTTQEHTE